ncbi:MAG: GTP-binding protein [Acidobacteria bacterium]|nr:GTP-binding protein [Acidobacteriota bacterium]
MILQKICLLGATAVGKTSLVRRFVQGIFSDRYLTTVGVRIDKREVEIEGERIQLVVWDLSGEDEFAQLQMRYLRGSAGWILVADGTRPETLDKALELHQRAVDALGDRPAALLLNKADLVDQWRFSDERIAKLQSAERPVLRSSAKTGASVEEAFASVAAAARSRLR